MHLIWLNILVIIIFVLSQQLNAGGQLMSSDYEKPSNNIVGRNDFPALKRGKRYLDFTKGSRMSWRTTVKNNILKINTLWGYGFGFRANFPFPDKADRRRPFFKREVFQSLTDVLDGNGLDGQACVLKSFCTAHLDAESEFSGGMLFKLLKHIFTLLHSSHTTTSLVRASLFVTEQASSSNNNADTEIAFVSFNGSFPNDNKPIATTQSIATSAATVSTRKSEPVQILKRGKRYLDFLNTSRMFFRVNIKNNIVPKPVIWAHGYGFRCNYPIENDKKARPFRRDTYETLGELMDKSGFDGRACVLKAFCTAHVDENIDVDNGMLFKLLKYIFTLNDEDKKHFPYLKHENCHQILHSHCPLSFNNISPYTDDV